MSAMVHQSTRSDDNGSSSVATATTSSLNKNPAEHRQVALLQFLLRLLRRGGLLCVLLAVAKLLLGEPICAYMLQFYTVKLQNKGRQPVALQLWRTLGSHP